MTWREWGMLAFLCCVAFDVIYGIAMLACANSERYQHSLKHGKITSVQHGDRVDFYEDGKWIDVWKPEP